MLKNTVNNSINKMYRKIHNYFRPIPLPLGRWDYNITKEQMIRRIEMANEDHCGPCGYNSMNTRPLNSK